VILMLWLLAGWLLAVAPYSAVLFGSQCHSQCPTSGSSTEDSKHAASAFRLQQNFSCTQAFVRCDRKSKLLVFNRPNHLQPSDQRRQRQRTAICHSHLKQKIVGTLRARGYDSSSRSAFCFRERRGVPRNVFPRFFGDARLSTTYKS